MAINAKVDSTVYEGIEKITAGGKTVELSEVYSGSQSIIENGTYDIGGKAEVVVNVPTGGAAPTGTISITANGSYDVSDYAAAQVNVVEAGSISIDTVVMGNLATKNQDVVLADTTTKVQPGIFYQSQLRSISGNGVESIGTSAFYNAPWLVTADFPKAKTVNGSAFTQTNNLTNVNLPLCETVGSSAFNMSKIVTISLPACTKLENSAFQSCSALASIEVPAVANIGQSAFSNCTALTEIVLPALTTLGNMAFQNCSKLALVDIGPGLSKIAGNGVFTNCAALANVVLRSTTRVEKPYAIFNGTSGAIKVYVPSALISEYQNASDWANEISKMGITFAAIEGSDYE